MSVAHIWVACAERASGQSELEQHELLEQLEYEFAF